MELGQRYEAGIDAAIYLHDAQGPLIAVLPEVAASLSELGVTLGFDLYALLDEDESGSVK